MYSAWLQLCYLLTLPTRIFRKLHRHNPTYMCKKHFRYKPLNEIHNDNDDCVDGGGASSRWWLNGRTLTGVSSSSFLSGRVQYDRIVLPIFSMALWCLYHSQNQSLFEKNLTYYLGKNNLKPIYLWWFTC